MELCVLGTGSSGNSSLLRASSTPILIDAGFGPRAILKRIAPTGVTIPDLRAILLTHLDRDHFNPTWFDTLLQHRIPIYCHERHTHALYRHDPTTRSGVNARVLYKNDLIRTFNEQPFDIPSNTSDPIRVKPIHLAHDQNGTVGFRINTPTGDLGYATDLGRVPDALINAFTDVNILAIESNYDPPSQLASPRPEFLKHRIMGGSGHISNQQAHEAVTAIIENSTLPPNHIVLLHLSQQCNSPTLVNDLFESTLQKNTLTISTQTQPTNWLRLTTPTTPEKNTAPLQGEQLNIFND